jgi:HPt (histidine-containing phosphotransfer) domain-containing protein
MSHKQNKKNGKAPNSSLGAGGAHLLPEEAERVRELIAGQHSKAALQLAKDLHKRCATAESEALLTDAYTARIEDLLRLGMTVEAKALLGIVRERFPAALPRLAELEREIRALDGRLEDVVAPLGDPQLPAQERERIESFIRQRTYDLPALAAVSSLPPEHPLRVAAGALAAAFQAVTKGPVEDELLALTEVSRRSPLAAWKALIRAIACYYRREDAECRRWLLTIPDDAVPARLIPSLTAMLGTKSATGADFKLSLAEDKLLDAAGDHGAALRVALADLEEALHGRKLKRILDAARTAMTASRNCGAAVRERLRLHIAMRAGMHHDAPSAIEAAVGGAPRRDAYYFRLLARAMEEQHNVNDYAEAALVWGTFRREAIREKWFAAGSLEDAVLALHRAQLIEKAPADLIAEMKSEMKDYRKPRGWDKDEDLLSAGVLYECACKADPYPEAFQAWLNWARKNGPRQSADEVAERWRAARPGDIQPLLYLMESAEQRNAFKKSLKYLEEAENLDRLDPAVRRAKLRLLLSGALRHLQQHKTHLALKGIEQIEAVPEVRPGEIAALAAGLRWCSAAVDKDKAAQTKREAELNQSQGEVAAHLLLLALADAAQIGPTTSFPALKAAKNSAAELLAGATRACLLMQWAGLAVNLPLTWNNPLIAALKLPNCPVDAGQLLILGEAALANSTVELAYAVSTAGLANGGAKAEFLFLRARSIPQMTSLRQDGCLTAALELARRERNTDLVGRILDRLNGKKKDGRGSRDFKLGIESDPTIASRPVSSELLSMILEEEQALTEFPGYNPGPEPKYAEELGYSLCDCQKCRARRGKRVDESEFSDDEDDDSDEDDFDEGEDGFEEEFDRSRSPLMGNLAMIVGEFLAILPPAKRHGVMQELQKAVEAGEDPIVAVARIMSKTPLPPQPPEKAKKAVKAPLPEQGSLF